MKNIPVDGELYSPKYRKTPDIERKPHKIKCVGGLLKEKLDSKPIYEKIESPIPDLGLPNYDGLLGFLDYNFDEPAKKIRIPKKRIRDLTLGEIGNKICNVSNGIYNGINSSIDFSYDGMISAMNLAYECGFKLSEYSKRLNPKINNAKSKTRSYLDNLKNKYNESQKNGKYNIQDNIQEKPKKASLDYNKLKIAGKSVAFVASFIAAGYLINHNLDLKQPVKNIFNSKPQKVIETKVKENLELKTERIWNSAAPIIFKTANKYIGTRFKHCWAACEFVYNKAGARMAALYSEGNKEHKWVSENYFHKNLKLCKEKNYTTLIHPKIKNKIDKYDLQSGDLFQIYNRNPDTAEHNLIFHSWLNRKEKIALVYNQMYIDKGLRFTRYNLKNNPPTIIWKPVPRKYIPVAYNSLPKKKSSVTERKQDTKKTEKSETKKPDEKKDIKKEAQEKPKEEIYKQEIYRQDNLQNSDSIS